ncbi:hypothetical protein K1719_020380 [Acacia pycnantha]|nr:hypothetical protein K1719_020380 [Acacia pycnantha]
MASHTKYCFLLASVLAISILNNGTAIEEETEAIGNKAWLTVSLSSLLPSSTCTPFTGLKKKSSLEVIQRHGPCCEQKHGKAKSKSPTQIDILIEDQARVNSIHSKLSKSFSHGNIKQLDSTILPVRSGLPVNTGDYIVTVSFGSPKRDLSLVFDTGSDLTWTQCEPCLEKCYIQLEPIFDPSKSTTYSPINNCPSSECSQIFSTGRYQECANSTEICIYMMKYADTSSSIGVLSRERLTIGGAGDTFDNFLFGCGQNNQGIAFGAAGGILGLGRSPISFVQQTANTYNKVFTYCLPSSPSSLGHLTFGSDGVPKNVQYTPIFTIAELPGFYGISITGIIVGETELPSANSTLLSTKAIIDSGTVITRLPPSVYSSLRSEFRQKMWMYPMTSGISILDTCYDLSGHDSVNIPKISLVFDGGVKLDLGENGIIYDESVKIICLAFAPNMSDEDVLVLGNIQQRTVEVVYDLNAERLGFGPLGGCD